MTFIIGQIQNINVLNKKIKNERKQGERSFAKGKEPKERGKELEARRIE